MTTAKQRKVLAGVLGAAVVILTADRVFFGGGTSVVGEATASSAADGSTATGGSDLASLIGKAKLEQAVVGSPAELAARFEAYAGEQGNDRAVERDAFAPPLAWLGADAQDLRVPVGSGMSASDFKAKYQLSAVMQGSSPSALIGRTFVRKGDVIDGFELVEVRARSVLLRAGEHEVVLTLDERNEDR